MNVKTACPDLTDEQCRLVERYLDLLEATNAHINLTAIRDRNEMIALHVADSLTAAPLLARNARVLDVGCGAGLPSVILKIARPDLDFLLADSVRKKTDFVNATIAELGLTGIRAVHTRIEDLRERNFNYVVARAVAPLPVLAEYALPFLRTGGELIAYKGERAEEEIENALHALDVLGGEVARIERPNLNGLRHALIVVRKTRTTPPQYPRPRNLPRIKPL